MTYEKVDIVIQDLKTQKAHSKQMLKTREGKICKVNTT